MVVFEEKKKISAVIFFQFLVSKALDPDWIRIGIQSKMLDPDPDEMNADPQPWLQHTLGEDSLRVNDELFSWCCRVRGSIPPSSPYRWPPPPVSSTFPRRNSAPKFIPKFLR